jgi:glycosyltransferase involved in cell wall biosynthesis
MKASLMHEDRRKSLAVITSLGARQGTDGRYQLTQKFVDGMQAYAEAWDGDVCAYFHSGAVDPGNLDHVEVAPGDVDFGMRVVRFDSPDFYGELEGRGVVLGMHHLLPDLALRCLELGVPCVYNSEYTLRTRLQLVRTDRKGVLSQLRSGLWELREEARVAKQIRIADGIQCNGLPTYLKYGPLNRAPLLYFDSRVREAALVTDGEILEQNERRERKRPLHLVFSGRLIRSKGADHLIRVATLLREKRVPFRMTICGDGQLRPGMVQQIEAAGLGTSVSLPGVLNFGKELLPFMKQSADLFVCCHLQGDPSCTYLETFSCGVPIVGYDNEALSTLLAQSEAGRAVPKNDAEALVKLIAELDQDRARLSLWAYRARNFAAKHTMERTFGARVQHLLGVRNGFLHRGRPMMAAGRRARVVSGATRLG